VQWRWCWQGYSAAAWRWKFVDQRAEARRLPGGSVHGANHALFRSEPPGGERHHREEWQQFVDRDVTPRFRDGLTVFDARGQWLGQNGQVAREQSKALMLIHGKMRRARPD
jgi:hypothetical protein